MSDPFIGLALKFIEQGGLYALLGIVVIFIGMAVWTVRALFNRIEQRDATILTIMDARIEDMRRIAKEATDALVAQRMTNEAATRAAEANARLTEAHTAAVGALKDAVSAFGSRADAPVPFSGGRRRT